MSVRRRVRRGLAIPFAVAVACTFLFTPAWVCATILALTSPAEGVEVTTSKPEILIASDVPLSAQTLLVQLDGVDITGALDFTANGFRFRPVQPLQNGAHQLYLVVYAADGSSTEQVFTFSTLTKVASSTDISAVYEQKIARSADLTQIPHRNVAANLGHTTTLTQGAWQLGGTTNLRWLDRSLPISEPEKKGIDLVNYLAYGSYQDEDFSLLVSAGDQQIQLTPNTVSGLARRGVQTAINYHQLSLNSFIVRSDQVYGLDEGSGLEFDSAKTIRGVSASYSLLEERLKLSTLYVSGAEESNSFGVYDANNQTREGDVLGFLVHYELLDSKLKLDAEYDLAEFDPDNTDQLAAESDKAWNLSASASVGSYNYQAFYEYVGPEYQVVGNPNLQRDREGLSLMGGVQKPLHSLNLQVSRYQDNVEESELIPQLQTTSLAADYTFTRFPNLPMGLSYQKTLMDARLIPEGGLPYETASDQYGAHLNYLVGAWNLGVLANYSLQDDKTANNYDSSAQTYGFSPVYSSGTFSVTPGVTFNRSSDDTRSLDTDTWTSTLDLRGALFQNQVAYEFGGTFNRMKTSDASMEADMLNTNARLTYFFQQTWAHLINPTIGVRGFYNRTDDKIYAQQTDEFALFLVLSTSMGFAF